MSPNPPAPGHPSSAVEGRVEAEQPARPFLLYTDGDARQRRFVFESDAVCASVGRRPPADLLLEWDGRVSRRHARFERDGQAWEIVDDGPSRNGTFVNEERLSGRRRLRDGDTLRFGATTVTFHSGQGEPDPAPIPLPVRLSTTQRRVLAALCRPYQAAEGLAPPASDEQIAEELVLSTAAVRTHLSVLCAKLGVEQRPGDETRVLLVQRALSAGLISARGR